MVGCGIKTHKSSNNYLLESYKNVYIDVVDSFASLVRTKVNEGKNLKLFDTDVLYMIPVGNDSNKSCITEEYSDSPFSDTWNYAFVGVRYSGEGYYYYIITEDSEGYGIPFSSSKDLYDKSRDLIYMNGNGIDKEIRDYLKLKYIEANNKKANLSEIDKKIIKSYNELSDVKKIVYIIAPECKYDPREE